MTSQRVYLFAIIYLKFVLVNIIEIYLYLIIDEYIILKSASC